MDISVLFAVLVYLAVCRGEMLAGPYTIIPERVDPCPEGMTDMPFPIAFHIARDRKNQNNYFVFANLTSHTTLDDDKEAHLNFASWSSRGGWKENAVRMKFKRPCAVTKQYLPTMWNNTVSVVTSTTGATDCPFPPGSYAINNVSSAALVPPKKVPVFFYGRWRVDVKCVDVKMNKVGACMRILGQTVPRTVAKTTRQF